jgi:hypothetical protein
MKQFISLFAVCMMCSLYPSTSIEEVYSNIQNAACEYGEDPDDTSFLHQYLQNELAGLDTELLKNDTEILYFKVLAGFDSAFEIDDIQEFKDRMTSLKNDIRFIMDYSPYNSRLYAAAQLRLELVTNFIGIRDFSDSEMINAYKQFLENNLKKFASDQELSGIELRQQVLDNINSSKELKNAFLDFILLCEEEIDIVLNRYTLEKYRLLGIQEVEDLGALLGIEVVLSNEKNVYNIEIWF